MGRKAKGASAQKVKKQIIDLDAIEAEINLEQKKESQELGVHKKKLKGKKTKKMSAKRILSRRIKKSKKIKKKKLSSS